MIYSGKFEKYFPLLYKRCSKTHLHYQRTDEGNEGKTRTLLSKVFTKKKF